MEQILASIGVLLGAVLAFFGAQSARRMRRAQESTFVRTQELLHLVHVLLNDPLLEEAEVQKLKELESRLLLVLSQQGKAGIHDKMVNTGFPRTGTSLRTVKVQSRDGSTFSFGIDPRNADSIDDFLDDARSIDAQRVVGVH